MDIMKQYRTGIRKLDRLFAKGEGDSEEADRIRDDLLDDSWYKMTPEQQDEGRLFSAKLHVIQDLKDFIKKLAAAQNRSKFFRKKRVQEANPEAWEKYCDDWDGMTIYERRIKITASLNWYHVLRGTPYRHQIERVCPYYYDRAENEVREKFCLKEREPVQT